MDDREFWAQAFFGSEAWKDRGNATLAAIDADAALAAYRERFGTVPTAKLGESDEQH